MRHALCILLALALAGDCWAGQIFRGSTTGGGGSTTWGPTTVVNNEDDSGGEGAPPGYNDCLDGDGITVGTSAGLGAFWDTSIPQGATITSAEIKFYVGYLPAAETVRVYGELVPTPANFSSGSSVPTRYITRTTSYHQNSLSLGLNTYNGSSMVSVIQELVNQSTFNGNIVLFIWPTVNASGTQIHQKSSESCGTTFASLEVTYE